MESRETVTKSADDTLKLGGELASSLSRGDIVGFVGALGAGKTVLIKGICGGLGYNGIVTSPTFNLINIYSGEVEIYHFDCYRLDGVTDLADIGYEEYFFGGKGICLVEWADRIPGALPEDTTIIDIEIISDHKRKIRIIPSAQFL